MLEGNKGTSSARLCVGLDLEQKSAWFPFDRIHEARAGELLEFVGPVEMDES